MLYSFMYVIKLYYTATVLLAACRVYTFDMYYTGAVYPFNMWCTCQIVRGALNTE